MLNVDLELLLIDIFVIIGEAISKRYPLPPTVKLEPVDLPIPYSPCRFPTLSFNFKKKNGF
jgi:hypothetical protein